MLYVSEYTGNHYSTAEECEKADEKYLAEKQEKELAEQKKKDERGTRAKEVEEALEAYQKAKNNYQTLLYEFLKDYGSFHYTHHWADNTKDPHAVNFCDIAFDTFFNKI